MRAMPKSRRAMMAYSISRIEFLVAMPISMIRPIIDGIDSAVWVMKSARKALVLSIPGAFLALFITHTAISMPSMIGLIMLMGIATKNSILLVDYVILARREHGLARFEAVLDACHKRARPIIMTTIAMGVGMLPITLGWGVAPSFRSPMATS